MKREFIILIVTGSILFGNACREDEIMQRDESLTSLNFAKKSYSSVFDEDSIQLEALFNSSAEVYRLKLPVCLSGKMAETDREYRIEVNEKETSGLTEGKHFTLERKHVFHADRAVDTVIVDIHIPAVMSERVEGRLYIKLVPDAVFNGGIEDFQYMVIRISGAGLSSMPNFWTYNNLTDYGGEYLAVKAEKFIELNAIPNAKWRAPNKAVLYAYARKTYEWFENNPTLVDGKQVHFKGIINY